MLDLFDKVCDEDLLTMFEEQIQDLLLLLQHQLQSLCKSTQKVVLHLTNIPLSDVYKGSLKSLKPNDLNTLVVLEGTVVRVQV